MFLGISDYITGARCYMKQALFGLGLVLHNTMYRFFFSHRLMDCSYLKNIPPLTTLFPRRPHWQTVFWAPPAPCPRREGPPQIPPASPAFAPRPPPCTAPRCLTSKRVRASAPPLAPRALEPHTSPVFPGFPIRPPLLLCTSCARGRPSACPTRWRVCMPALSAGTHSARGVLGTGGRGAPAGGVCRVEFGVRLGFLPGLVAPFSSGGSLPCVR